MVKEFKTTSGTAIKASFNFRTNTIRVWELLVSSKQWYKSFFISGLTSKQMNEIALNFKADEFRKFMIESKHSSIWR